MSVSTQPKPLPEKPSDVVPPITDDLAKLLEVGDLASQAYLTQCLCGNCGFHKEFEFGCAQKDFCLACCQAQQACNCFKLTEERPFVYNNDACFCLKCCVCYNVASCCDFPFPCDSESHQLCCNWEKQQTICGGAGNGRCICCTQYREFSCLQPTEVPCFTMRRMFCLECRFACLPGANKDVPLACGVFGKTLWSK